MRKHLASCRVCLHGDDELKKEYLTAQMGVLAGNYGETSESYEAAEQYETDETIYDEGSGESNG